MSDEEDRRVGSLIPFVGRKTVSRSTSLVRRGLDLLDGRKPTDDATIAQLCDRAKAGDAAAQYLMGEAYIEGQGVPHGWTHAVKWYRKAAEQGHAGALVSLGWAYLVGLGVTEDHAQAVQWFRKAAEQGDAAAQGCLGYVYVEGLGVTQDDTQAAQWYRKAAEQGDAGAQHWLGHAYSTGLGVPQDHMEAHKWMNLAVLHNRRIADQKRLTDGRDAVAKTMTPAEIADAEERAKEWTEGFQRRKPQGK